MRYKILLTAISLAASFLSFSQQKSNYAYVITSPGNNKTVGWTEVKMIDLTTGQLLQNVFESNMSYSLFDARSKKLLKESNKAVALNQTAPSTATQLIRDPFDTYSAAAAYDAKHQRLYYTPMGINQLRYIEPNTGKIYYFNNEPFGVAKDLNDLANHITRMTFDPNGIGYALSNDGNHFISFTTDKNPVITDLGAVSDAASNKDVSIHAQQTSWGGDMVADRVGNLYLISAHQALFRINIQTQVATYLGTIAGFPENFSSNGAAVDDDGNLVVSSASSTAGYYVVDIPSLTCKRYGSCDSSYVASDLANGNFLFENKNLKKVDNSKLSVYPNPVVNGLVYTNFNNLPAGKYSIQLLDQSGKLLSQKMVDVKIAGQVESIATGSRLSRGEYVVKVVPIQGSKNVTVTKILVQ
ncbi:T9SS type A sorting domain-containing protein [Chitinophagaceae bacterium 26-R-25]|nr:T9SS type A sorting domain-containing protein [Chitinophagaceae bacterium 26-R-25]